MLVLLAIPLSVAANAGIDEGTNALRVQHGLAPLSTSATLSALAAQRAQEIVLPNFSHNISVLEQRVTNALGCWRLLGENIAYRTAPTGDATFVGMWAASLEHLANMLAPSFTAQGSATFTAGGRTYAVQIFVATCSSAPVPAHSQPSPASAPSSATPYATPAPLVPNTAVSPR